MGKRKRKVTMTVVRTFRLPSANVATTWCIEQSEMEGDNQMSHTFSLFKGLASHCKAEATFTFHSSILTLLNPFLSNNI